MSGIFAQCLHRLRLLQGSTNYINEKKFNKVGSPLLALHLRITGLRKSPMYIMKQPMTDPDGHHTVRVNNSSNLSDSLAADPVRLQSLMSVSFLHLLQNK